MSKKSKKKEGLLYIPGGYLPGVPARALTPEEVERHGGAEFLISTGRYRACEKVDIDPQGAEKSAKK